MDYSPYFILAIFMNQKIFRFFATSDVTDAISSECQKTRAFYRDPWAYTQNNLAAQMNFFQELPGKCSAAFCSMAHQYNMCW